MNWDEMNSFTTGLKRYLFLTYRAVRKLGKTDERRTRQGLKWYSSGTYDMASLINLTFCL